jgi:hypothetical protein
MDATGTPASQAFIQKEGSYGARNYAPVPVVVDHAKDCLCGTWKARSTST